MKLNVEKINILKDKEYITQIIPSENILSEYDTVYGLKIGKLITSCDPTDDIEDLLSDDEEKYLIFEAITDGTIGFEHRSYGGELDALTILYSRDEGQTWDEWEAERGGNNIEVSAGDVIYIKGNNTVYGKPGGPWHVNRFIATARFYAYGDICALLDKRQMEDDALSHLFEGCTNLFSHPTKKLRLSRTDLSTRCYSGLFQGCTGITKPAELPATTLADNCYSHMYDSCSSLVKFPELPATSLTSYCYACMFRRCYELTEVSVLSATTLADHCYYGMFASCESLVHAPELPATTLANYCYREMFNNCKSLVDAPNLPATTLAQGCYYAMFYDCKNLKNTPTILPSTELADYCYAYMFFGCSNLIETPVLPAPVLKFGCYNNMFCYSKINKVICLATDISAERCTEYWLLNTTHDGIFYKNPDMNDWPVGNDGIPNGWTVEDYQI